ncbi:MAG: chemotaxis response regulator protein-glutamate methylesterase [Burkholderiales bacterium]|nr:chemotaxis response regulator protein-glutamate methylesterase [Burkholderiales bacterium]
MTAAAAAPPRIKVMIVDDSAVVREVLSAVIGADPGLRVIATAPDPIAARLKMNADWPDVIVLDVEMPRMDGITFLRQLMAERPTPVVICSTLTEKGAKTTMLALSAGAVTFVTKPTLGLRDFLQGQAAEFSRIVRDAARARPRRSVVPATASGAGAGTGAGAGVTASALAGGDDRFPRAEAMARTTEQVVAIGTSTGGTQALETVLTALPRVCPGIVIVQHMPEKFTAQFAARLNGLCRLEVREAANGDRVLPGRALIAPGGRHMRMVRNGAIYQVEIFDGPPVNRHRPSVDVLFRSVAKVAGANALGIIMTGMGDDGARGLLDMHDRGARTVAQDEDSCVVFGMPKEAIKLGAADRVMPLGSIASEITNLYRQDKK